MERVHIFGIRHHGPGSARSLKSALHSLQPDVLLVEGPPDADALLPLALHEAMQPPVALLIYAPDDPACAAYYPFAVYSPEWQAIRYGLASGIPVRMMDLPQAVQMAMARQQMEGSEAEEQPATGELPAAEEQPEVEEEFPGDGDQPPGEEPSLDSTDPLRLLAEAAGYSESEQWWDHLVEQYRGHPQDLFTAILEAMAALRESTGPETHPVAIRREAAMRSSIRAALEAGYQRIAVVCGAWHSPALLDLTHRTEDEELLAGLPKIEICATWVPWTHARLTRLSGYGAGIDSPGWYSHLWETETGITTRWMIRMARLLRDEDLDISPAHIIEAVRLSETLAALRDRPLPGLPELNEAALAVFCFGNPLPLRLIEEKLIVGDRLGSVPPETPMAPLQQDFERETRRLKMAPEAAEKLLDLDLRKPFDLERSHLLHRLNLLGVPWGRASGSTRQSAARGRGGTFHEIWTLKWQPEFAILLIEAGQWGNTIAAAASAQVSQAASRAPDLRALTGLVEDVLLAELPEAVRHLMDCLRAQAAVSSDMRHLMEALPPLAGVLRYGNVRQTDTQMVAEVVDGLAARVFIGLPGACMALNDDAAGEIFELVMKVDDAINRLAMESYQQEWNRTLARLADLPNVHGLIAGRACRILRDGGILTADEAARRLGLALSAASDPLQATAWVEGFLRGSGQFLVHDDGLLGVIDGWLTGLPEAAFTRLLPLLRRTFSAFSRPERRSIGERVKRGGFASTTGTQAGAHGQQDEMPSKDFDQRRADAVLPLVARLLGIELSSPSPASQDKTP